MILVVEDDMDIAQALIDALETEGYAVSHARHGREALPLLNDARIELVLLDWMMPVMDGETFLASARDAGSIGSIPVVVLTADLRLASRAHELAIADFLCKPVDLDVLLRTCARWTAER